MINRQPFKKFTIVKHAGKTWEKYWRYDPKLGTSIEINYTLSSIEKICNIKESYKDLNEAKKACELINKVNPIGDYAICPIID